MSQPIQSCPEFLTSQDLVDLGLFPSTKMAYDARIKGNSPDFIRIGKKVLYPKALLIEFINKNVQLNKLANGE